MKKSTIKRIIRLDGRRMTDRAATHSYLKDKFGFPDRKPVDHAVRRIAGKAGS